MALVAAGRSSRRRSRGATPPVVDGQGRNQQAGQLLLVEASGLRRSRDAAAVGLQDLRRRTRRSPSAGRRAPVTISYRQSDGTLLSQRAQIHFIRQRPADANDPIIVGRLSIFWRLVIPPRQCGRLGRWRTAPSQLPEVTAELLFGFDHWNQAGLAHSELMRQGMRRKGGCLPR